MAGGWAPFFFDEWRNRYTASTVLSVPSGVAAGRLSASQRAASTSLSSSARFGQNYALVVAATPNLASYWRLFGDGQDERGVVNATLVGSPMTVTGIPGGQGNGALALNGSTQYLSLGDVYRPEGAQAFSFECWFLLARQPNGTARLAGNYSSAPLNGWHLFLYDGALNINRLADNTTTTKSFAPPTGLRAGVWSHAVATYDGNTLHAYLNGETGGPTTTTTASISPYTGAFRLGASSQSLSNALSGLIDEAAWYTRALTAQEVAAHYLAGVGGRRVAGLGRSFAAYHPVSAIFGATYRAEIIGTPNLLGYWRLNEASGSVAADEKATYPGAYSSIPSYRASGALQNDTNAAVGLGLTGVVTFGATGNFGFYGTQAFSVECWFKMAALDPATIIQRYNPSDANGYRVRIISASALGALRHAVRAERWVNNSDLVTTYHAPSTEPAALTLRAGVWNHAVMTYDGAVIRMYVNGIEEGSVNDTRALVTPATEQGLVSQWSLFPNGQVDEVAVYDRALTPDEVGHHYQAAYISGFGVREVVQPIKVEPVPVSLYADSFDQGALDPSWTLVEQTASYTVTDGLAVTLPQAANVYLTLRHNSAPDPLDFQVVARVDLPGGAAGIFALSLQEGDFGPSVTLTVHFNGGDVVFGSSGFTSTTTNSAVAGGGVYWFRLWGNGAERGWDLSVDGATWTRRHTRSRSATATLADASVKVRFVGFDAQATTRTVTMEHLGILTGVAPVNSVLAHTAALQRAPALAFPLTASAGALGARTRAATLSPEGLPTLGVIQVDDFENGVIDPRWTVETEQFVGSPVVTATETGGAIELRVVRQAGEEGAVNLFTQTIPTRRGLDTWAEIDPTATQSASLGLWGAFGQVRIDYWEGQLTASQVVGETSASLTYDPVAHRWWRIYEVGDALRCQVGPDGATWTTLFTSGPIPVWGTDPRVALTCYAESGVAEHVTRVYQFSLSGETTPQVGLSLFGGNHIEVSPTLNLALSALNAALPERLRTSFQALPISVGMARLLAAPRQSEISRQISVASAAEHRVIRLPAVNASLSAPMTRWGAATRRPGLTHRNTAVFGWSYRTRIQQTSGMQWYWPLDSTAPYAGGVTLAQSGVSFLSGGIPGIASSTSASLTGSSSTLTGGDAGAYDHLGVRTPFSVEIWALPEATSIVRTMLLIEHTDSEGRGWSLNYTSGVASPDGSVTPGYFLVWYTVTNGGAIGVNSLELGSLPEGSWYHVVATYSGSTVFLYINGRPHLAQGYLANFDRYLPTGGVLRIGNHPNIRTRFQGRLAEAALYTEALSAAEVEAHYRSGVGRQPVAVRRRILYDTSNVLLASFTSGYRAEILATPNLAHYWRLGDSAGASVAADELGAVNGTYNGTRSTLSGGLQTDTDTAIRFTANGITSSGYVAVANATTVDLFHDNAAFTLEFWVYWIPNSASQYLFGKITESTGWSLNITSAGALQVMRGLGTSMSAMIVSNASPRNLVLPENRWSYVALTYAGGVNGVIRMYLNTETRTGYTVSGTGVGNTTALTIGRSSAGSAGSALNSVLDEVAIYTRALRADEILRHYTAAVRPSITAREFRSPLTATTDNVVVPAWYAGVARPALVDTLFSGLLDRIYTTGRDITLSTPLALAPSQVIGYTPGRLFADIALTLIASVAYQGERTAIYTGPLGAPLNRALTPRRTLLAVGGLPETFTDTFADGVIDPFWLAVWTDGESAPSETGRLQADLPADGGTLVEYRSAQVYTSLLGMTITMEGAVELGEVTLSFVGQDWRPGRSTDLTSAIIEYQILDGVVYTDKHRTNEGWLDAAAPVPYDPAVHRWLRIVVDEDGIHWLHSPDGVTWTLRAQQSLLFIPSVMGWRVRVYAETDQGASSASWIDNVSVVYNPLPVVTIAHGYHYPRALLMAPEPAPVAEDRFNRPDGPLATSTGGLPWAVSLYNTPENGSRADIENGRLVLSGADALIPLLERDADARVRVFGLTTLAGADVNAIRAFTLGAGAVYMALRFDPVGLQWSIRITRFAAPTDDPDSSLSFTNTVDIAAPTFPILLRTRVLGDSVQCWVNDVRVFSEPLLWNSDVTMISNQWLFHGFWVDGLNTEFSLDDYEVSLALADPTTALVGRRMRERYLTLTGGELSQVWDEDFRGGALPAYLDDTMYDHEPGMTLSFTNGLVFEGAPGTYPDWGFETRQPFRTDDFSLEWSWQVENVVSGAYINFSVTIDRPDVLQDTAVDIETIDGALRLVVYYTNVTGVSGVTSYPFNPVAHRWMRLRGAGQSMSFSASADGVNWFVRVGWTRGIGHMIPAGVSAWIYTGLGAEHTQPVRATLDRLQLSLPSIPANADLDTSYISGDKALGVSTALALNPTRLLDFQRPLDLSVALSLDLQRALEVTNDALTRLLALSVAADGAPTASAARARDVALDLAPTLALTREQALQRLLVALSGLQADLSAAQALARDADADVALSGLLARLQDLVRDTQAAVTAAADLAPAQTLARALLLAAQLAALVTQAPALGRDAAVGITHQSALDALQALDRAADITLAQLAGPSGLLASARALLATTPAAGGVVAAQALGRILPVNLALLAQLTSITSSLHGLTLIAPILAEAARAQILARAPAATLPVTEALDRSLAAARTAALTQTLAALLDTAQALARDTALDTPTGADLHPAQVLARIVAFADEVALALQAGQALARDAVISSAPALTLQASQTLARLLALAELVAAALQPAQQLGRAATSAAPVAASPSSAQELARVVALLLDHAAAPLAAQTLARTAAWAAEAAAAADDAQTLTRLADVALAALLALPARVDAQRLLALSATTLADVAAGQTLGRDQSLTLPLEAALERLLAAQHGLAALAPALTEATAGQTLTREAVASGSYHEALMRAISGRYSADVVVAVAALIDTLLALGRPLEATADLGVASSAGQSLARELALDDTLILALQAAQTLARTPEVLADATASLAAAQTLTRLLDYTAALLQALQAAQALGRDAAVAQDADLASSAGQTLARGLDLLLDLDHTLQAAQTLTRAAEAGAAVLASLAQAQTLARALSETLTVAQAIATAQTLGRDAAVAQPVALQAQVTQALGRLAQLSAALLADAAAALAAERPLDIAVHQATTIAPALVLQRDLALDAPLAVTLNEALAALSALLVTLPAAALLQPAQQLGRDATVVGAATLTSERLLAAHALLALQIDLAAASATVQALGRDADLALDTDAALQAGQTVARLLTLAAQTSAALQAAQALQRAPVVTLDQTSAVAAAQVLARLVALAEQVALTLAAAQALGRDAASDTAQASALAAAQVVQRDLATAQALDSLLAAAQALGRDASADGASNLTLTSAQTLGRLLEVTAALLAETSQAQTLGRDLLATQALDTLLVAAQTLAREVSADAASDLTLTPSQTLARFLEITAALLSEVAQAQMLGRDVLAAQGAQTTLAPAQTLARLLAAAAQLDALLTPAQALTRAAAAQSAVAADVAALQTLARALDATLTLDALLAAAQTLSRDAAVMAPFDLALGQAQTLARAVEALDAVEASLETLAAALRDAAVAVELQGATDRAQELTRLTSWQGAILALMGRQGELTHALLLNLAATATTARTSAILRDAALDIPELLELVQQAEQDRALALDGALAATVSSAQTLARAAEGAQLIDLQVSEVSARLRDAALDLALDAGLDRQTLFQRLAATTAPLSALIAQSGQALRAAHSSVTADDQLGRQALLERAVALQAEIAAEADQQANVTRVTSLAVGSALALLLRVGYRQRGATVAAPQAAALGAEQTLGRGAQAGAALVVLLAREAALRRGQLSSQALQVTGDRAGAVARAGQVSVPGAYAALRLAGLHRTPAAGAALALTAARRIERPRQPALSVAALQQLQRGQASRRTRLVSVAATTLLQRATRDSNLLNEIVPLDTDAASQVGRLGAALWARAAETAAARQAAIERELVVLEQVAATLGARGARDRAALLAVALSDALLAESARARAVGAAIALQAAAERGWDGARQATLDLALALAAERQALLARQTQAEVGQGVTSEVVRGFTRAVAADTLLAVAPERLIALGQALAAGAQLLVRLGLRIKMQLQFLYPFKGTVAPDQQAAIDRQQGRPTGGKVLGGRTGGGVRGSRTGGRVTPSTTEIKE